MQQNLAQRLNDLQSETRREQRGLVAAFQRICDRHQLGNDESRRRTRANRSPVMARYNDIPYEDTQDTVEWANLMLFAPRADEESSTAYDRHESAQLLYLAREQHERDREKRNRAAEEWAWSVCRTASQTRWSTTWWWPQRQLACSAQWSGRSPWQGKRLQRPRLG